MGFFDSYRKEVYMLKVQVLVSCSHCNGKAYLPMGEAIDCQGNKYTRHMACSFCEGSGNEPKWLDLHDFAKLMKQSICPHNHSSFQGNLRFSAGDVWDDIHEVCDDCGANLDQPIRSDSIKDEN
jgi:DnaJ-class molecular chaperone